MPAGILSLRRIQFLSMSKRNSSNKKKSQGIWIIERKPDEDEILPSILEKSWKDVSSMDLYRLYNFDWKTEEICQKFKVNHNQVINKLRY